ncbi:MAG TPA: hypothetical protein VGO47_11485 [Chlamydiales bacterium]|nr:hypothetical protein [Chlamydiales bacterium]
MSTPPLPMSCTPLSLYVAIIFGMLIFVAGATPLATHEPGQVVLALGNFLYSSFVFSSVADKGTVLGLVIILISAVFIYPRWVKSRRSSGSLPNHTQGSIGSNSSGLPDELKIRANEDAGNSVNLQVSTLVI